LTTDCTPRQLELQGVGGRRLVARFDGGTISSDGGVVLLAAVERRRHLLARFAACFEDFRDPAYVEHTMERLVAQRVLGVALGYEDLIDHDELRADPLLAAVLGSSDPEGRQRRQARDRGRALAGKSTLHRLEWGALEAAAEDRYRRIAIDPEAVDAFFVDAFLDRFEEPPEEIVLDLDATDDPLHGSQEGRFFHGYYGCYCYLPLYVFCGDDLLCARLRRSDIDASAGSVEELDRIVGQIRAAWPGVSILVRGDSAFARQALMDWCEQHGVDYVFGLARNPRLEAALEPALERAEALCAVSGEPERLYDEWMHSTAPRWPAPAATRSATSCSRSAPGCGSASDGSPSHCARGEMENRIKEQLTGSSDCPRESCRIDPAPRPLRLPTRQTTLPPRPLDRPIHPPGA